MKMRLEAIFDVKNRVLVFEELFDYDIECIYSFIFDTKKKRFNIDVSISGKVKNIEIEKIDKENMLIERVVDNLDKVIVNYDKYCRDLEKKVYREFQFIYNQNDLTYEIKSDDNSIKKMIVTLLIYE